MRWYYLKFKKQDIMKILEIYYNYQSISISLEEILIIASDEFEWPIERVTKAWGYCVYCGLLQQE